MAAPSTAPTPELIEDLDSLLATTSFISARLLVSLKELAARDVHLGSGHKDMAAWVAARFQTTRWMASRLLYGSQVIADFPKIYEALATGAISLEVALELVRFATPQTEASLIAWAAKCPLSQVRRRAARESRRDRTEVTDAKAARQLHYHFTDDSEGYWLEAFLPSAEGAIVARALERTADQIPASPVDGDPANPPYGSRLADALVALCSNTLATDADADRSTVVVHARLADLVGGIANSAIQGGPLIAPEVTSRLACDARIQTIVHGDEGILGIGYTDRNVPPWMRRVLEDRDETCRFPGCGSKALLEAHHIVFWENGGPTELFNLLLVCRFHHYLVHEHRWQVALGPIPGTADWFRPDGTPYEPGGAGARQVALVG